MLHSYPNDSIVRLHLALQHFGKHGFYPPDSFRHHFPLADFLAARPAILGTLASSLRLTGEDMNKSFKQIKDYPFDIVAYRFALPPTEAARASKMGLVYAEACRQIVSDVVGTQFSLFFCSRRTF